MSIHSNDTNTSLPPISLVTPIIYGILGLALVLANATVLQLFYRNRELRTVSNSFLASLAVSDLSTGLLAIPANIACILTLQLDVCISMDMCMRFLGFSTVSHLTVLTLERYVRITRPFEYRSRVTRGKSRLVIASMWVFSLAASLVQLIWIKDETISEDTIILIEIIYDIISFGIVVIIPLIIITIIYIAIFRYIRQHNRKSREFAMTSLTVADASRHQLRREASEKKVLAVFLAMIVIFILGTFLYFFLAIIIDLQEYHSIRFTPGTMNILIKSTMFFRYFSSLCNPLLLTFFKQDFYGSLRASLKK
ncbi:melanopsin [Nematostella vectensis]|uniref:melanopsin n=1 Tax=Nematostella vectensis TaxID=45351 RepID=UPI00138FA2E0|nr:melanopsin [Nematostella vectensis]XP_048583223.1 melanopsin [Nematostella vectensis]